MPISYGSFRWRSSVKMFHRDVKAARSQSYHNHIHSTLQRGLCDLKKHGDEIFMRVISLAWFGKIIMSGHRVMKFFMRVISLAWSLPIVP